MLTKTEEFVFFWNGPFSQWHKSDFTVSGLQYNCAEQFMMAQKARLFGDSITEGEIMDTTSPREQKALGRKVQNFDAAVWELHRFPIVLAACLAKFKQDERLKQVLLATGTMTLVEASPEDNIWGIGMREEDPLIQDKNNWKGLNLLGQALTCAREVIRAEMLMARQ